MIVELEVMASRPFAKAMVEVDHKDDHAGADKKDNNPDLRKRKRVGRGHVLASCNMFDYL